MKRTRFGVRPDYHTAEEINTLAPEEGVIVYDVDEKVNKFWNGSEWVSVDSSKYAAGYYGLLSDFYFDGVATSSEIIINQVDVWQDVIMTIHPSGINDERPVSMKLAQPTGYEGTGAVNDPIIFLLEGLVESSFATLRTSFGFTPDEDGGRLDARIFLNRHNGAGADFFIDGQSLTMESGADEEYAHLVSVEFFVGDTMDTNAPGDAGKVKFQIKSDVTGTVSMREMALFIQK
jgi:hypothetical protein